MAINEIIAEILEFLKTSKKRIFISHLYFILFLNYLPKRIFPKRLNKKKLCSYTM